MFCSFLVQRAHIQKGVCDSGIEAEEEEEGGVCGVLVGG